MVVIVSRADSKGHSIAEGSTLSPLARHAASHRATPPHGDYCGNKRETETETETADQEREREREREERVDGSRRPRSAARRFSSSRTSVGATSCHPRCRKSFPPSVCFFFFSVRLNPYLHLPLTNSWKLVVQPRVYMCLCNFSVCVSEILDENIIK